MVSSAYFASNIFFFGDTGYFTSPSHTKPLLHTWSLSIEEQFYVIWPMALLVLWRAFTLRSRMLVLFILIALSLAYSEWEIWHRNNAAAFYLLHARAWELLSGAALALIIDRALLGPRLAEAAAFAGLALIAAAVTIFTVENDFPGLNAVVPCLGAALLIIAGHAHQPLIIRLISQRAFVFVGLVSYSLYLWHWPIFSYAHVTMDRAPSLFEALWLILLSFGLAVASWKFIEVPFRKGRGRILPRHTVQTGIACIIAFVAVGVTVDSSGGFPQRFGAEAGKIVQTAARKPPRSKCHGELRAGSHRYDCDLGVRRKDASYDALLLGDSHAWHFSPAVSLALRENGLAGFQITQGGCVLLPGVNRLDGTKIRKSCQRAQENVRRFLQAHPEVRLVIIAHRWAIYAHEYRFEIDGRTGEPTQEGPKLIDAIDKDASAKTSRRVIARALRKFVAEMVASGRHVLLLGQVPAYRTAPARCVVRARYYRDDETQCYAKKEEILQRFSFAHELLRELTKTHTAVHTFFPTDILCNDHTCSPFLDGVFLYRDDDHLNEIGAEQLGKYLVSLPFFASLKKIDVTGNQP